MVCDFEPNSEEKMGKNYYLYRRNALKTAKISALRPEKEKYRGNRRQFHEKSPKISVEI